MSEETAPEIVPPTITRMTPAQRAMNEMLTSARHPDGLGLRQADMTGVYELRQRLKAETGVSFSWMDVIVKTIGVVLVHDPQFNVLADDSKFYQFHGIDVGISVSSSTPTAPVIVLRNVEKLSLLEIHEQRLELSKQAVAETEKNMEMLTQRIRFIPANVRRVVLRRFMNSAPMRHKYAGTVQVSAVELDTVDWFFPSHMVTSFMFTWGKIEPRPWVVDGKVEARHTINMGVSIDQRVINIVRLTRIMGRMQRIFKNPEKLLDARADSDSSSD